MAAVRDASAGVFPAGRHNGGGKLSVPAGVRLVLALLAARCDDGCFCLFQGKLQKVKSVAARGFGGFFAGACAERVVFDVQREILRAVVFHAGACFRDADVRRDRRGGGKCAGEA